MKYRTLAAALLLGSVMFTSCVDEFSELNSDPSTITKPDIRFLFTKCEASFQPGDYAQWFGGFNDLSTWSQTTVSAVRKKKNVSTNWKKVGLATLQGL